MTASILTAVANGGIVSGVLAAAVWLGLRLTPRHRLNAATRYAFWWAVLLSTVALPLLYLQAPGPRTAAAGAAPTVRQAAATAPIEVPLDVQIHGTAGPSAAGPRPATVTIRPEWIATSWLALSSILLTRLVLSWVLLDRRRARASRCARAERWLAQCREMRAGVRVATSTEIGIPVAVGPLHPSILIPARLAEELNDDDLGQIVIHEAAHLARRDDYALLVQRVMEALFALHPVVRWITRQLDLEREMACDDFVVAATGQPRSYAFCLTRMVELCGCVRTSLAGAMAADDRSHLSRRVERLLDRTRHTGTRLLKTRFAAMLALLLAAAWSVARTPALIAFAMPQSLEPVASVEPTPAPAVEPAPAPAPAPAEAPPPMPAPPAPPAPQQANANQVQVPVTVADPNGRFVTGLDRENFRLFEDDVEQHIDQFSTADTPLSVGIVVDTSGSMRNKLESVNATIGEFLKGSRPEDEFFVVPFNDEASVAVPFTHDASAVETAMHNLRPRGGTALRDGVHLALEQMKLARNPRKAILIVSDDEDNASSRSAATLREELRAADLLVYNIHLSDDPAAPRETRVIGQATTIAPDNVVELRNTAAGITTGLRNRYVLIYTSNNPAHDGKYRQLKVQLVQPAGIPPLTVRLPSGYYAPRR